MVRNVSRLLFLSLLFVVGSTLSYAQDSLVWGLHGKTVHLSRITEVDIFANGDVAFCGSHDSLITFGDYSFRGPKPKGATGATSSSLFIGRCSADKEIQWIHSFAVADAGLYMHDMKLDVHDNIWITASAEGNIEFINGETAVLQGTGVLLAKINPSGELLLGKTYSGLGTRVHNYHVLPRNDGKCYFLGNHGGGTFGESKIPGGSSGQYSEYIALVDSDGTPLWGKSIGGAGGAVTASDFTYDYEGNLLISGNYRYINTPNIIEEGTDNPKEKIDGGTQMSAGNVGGSVRPVGSTGGQIHPFIGKYDPNTGEPNEVHCYLGGAGGATSSMIADDKGNIYVGLSIYGSGLNIKGTFIPGKGNKTMAIVKLNKNWEVDWFKSFDAPGSSNYADDLCLDGNKLYAATMVSQGRFKADKIDFTTKGLWSGAILRLNANTGYCEWSDQWEVGRTLCVAMKDGEGYAGGWFHYATKVGRDRMETPNHGQFNAVLARIGKAEEEKELLAQMNRFVAQPLPETKPTPDLNGRPTIPFPSEPALSDKRREIRTSETQHRLEVRSETIKIEVWDNRQVDGDIISLKYNGTWILEDYRLRRKPHIIEIAVIPGQPNFIEMYSEDVGSIPPTTTQINIDDGNAIQSISLRSTPEMNGVIEVFWEN
ncbi:hypothetical protein N9Y60_02115 [Crocinitomicaceae bacterium]|nr:hypothetical protein [Crocinitomicaceae bacterium]